MFQGSIDFGQSLIGEAFTAYAPYEGMGQIIVVPKDLSLAKTDTNKPAFLLELVRSSTPTGLPKPHGNLYMSLDYPEIGNQAIESIRDKWEFAPIQKPVFSRGWLRICVKNLTKTSTSNIDFSGVFDLNGLHLSQVMLAQTLSADNANFIKKALKEKLLLFDVHTELLLDGIAPRVAATIKFNPLEFMRSLEKLLAGKLLVPYQTLLNCVQKSSAQLPINVKKGSDNYTPEVFALCLTDWLISRFGAYVPAPNDDLQTYVALKPSTEIEKGDFTWDLSTPLPCNRMHLFKFDASKAAIDLAASVGIHNIVRETVIPALNTGVVRISVGHELPEVVPEGIVSFGIKINVPSNAPFRPQAINKTVVFSNGNERSIVELRYSPSEKTQQYKYTTFVVIRDSKGTKELLGNTIATSDTFLNVKIADFPIQLISIEVEPSIFDEANINGVCSWKEQGKENKFSFKLSSAKTSVSFALPVKTDTERKCTIEAIDKKSTAALEANYSAVESIYVQRFAFPTYGPQQLEIQCNLDPGMELYAIELLPEGKEPIIANITVLSFTPTSAVKTWRWFAESLFQTGFAYRTYRPNESKPEPWSQIQSAQMKVLEIFPSKPKPKPMQGVPKWPGDVDFENLRYFPNPIDKNYFYFIPLEVGPQKDDQGAPSILLMIAGGVNMLQLSTRWHAEPSLLTELKSKIAASTKASSPALIQLSFGELVLEKAELVLIEGDEEKIIATAEPSNIYPSTAIFNVQLLPKQKDLVIAALHQRKNTLLVRYQAERVIEESVEVRIEGDLRKTLQSLKPESSFTECRAWLDEAIDDALFKVSKLGNPDADARLWAQAEAEALGTATTQIQEYLKQKPSASTAASLKVEIQRTGKQAIPFFIQTDLGDWFENPKEADEHIRIF